MITLGRVIDPRLKLADVLDELGMSRSAFYRMRARGKGPKCSKLPNGQLRFLRSDLDAWWADCAEDGSGAWD